MQKPSWVDLPSSSAGLLADAVRYVAHAGRGRQSDVIVPGTDFNRRDEANVLAAFAFRNGFLETLHAGLTGFSDDEMRKLMIEASAALARALAARDGDPSLYAQFLVRYGTAYSRHWERIAEKAVLERAHVVPCLRCSADTRLEWAFCASCGAERLASS